MNDGLNETWRRSFTARPTYLAAAEVTKLACLPLKAPLRLFSLCAAYISILSGLRRSPRPSRCRRSGWAPLLCEMVAAIVPIVLPAWSRRVLYKRPERVTEMLFDLFSTFACETKMHEVTLIHTHAQACAHDWPSSEMRPLLVSVLHCNAKQF